METDTHTKRQRQRDRDIHKETERERDRDILKETQILKGSHEQGTIFFTEAVKENSFWNDNGVLPGDVIKEIDGNVITLENANAIIGTAYSWVPGQKVEVKLERDGEEYTIAKELTPSYTTGMKLGRKQGASEEELKILEAWLRG